MRGSGVECLTLLQQLIQRLGAGHCDSGFDGCLAETGGNGRASVTVLVAVSLNLLLVVGNALAKRKNVSNFQNNDSRFPMILKRRPVGCRPRRLGGGPVQVQLILEISGSRSSSSNSSDHLADRAEGGEEERGPVSWLREVEQARDFELAHGPPRYPCRNSISARQSPTPTLTLGHRTRTFHLHS